MSAVAAPERTLNSVVGRDEFGGSLPLCEPRRTEREVRERLQDLERQMRRCEAELIATLAEADRTRVVPVGWASHGAAVGCCFGAVV